MIEDIYLKKIREKHPKYTRAKIRNLLNFDTILTAQETVDLGLADRIFGDNSEWRYKQT